jgi:hypothetical protein
MPSAPSPINSSPDNADQPYDSDAPGAGDAQSDATTIYEPAGSGFDWVKVQEGGAADWRTGKVLGGWADDGTSDGSAWKQA